VSSNIIPFIISRNRPKVKIVIGIVRIVKIGFMIALIIPKNKEAKKPDKNPRICTPATTCSVAKRAIIVRIILVRKLCLFFLITISWLDSYLITGLI